MWLLSLGTAHNIVKVLKWALIVTIHQRSYLLLPLIYCRDICNVNCTPLRVLSLSTARAETTEQQCIWCKALTFLTRFHPLNWLQNSDICFFTLLQSWLRLGYLSNRCCKGSYRDQQFQVPGPSDIWRPLLASYFPHNRSLASSSPLSCILWDL